MKHCTDMKLILVRRTC